VSPQLVASLIAAGAIILVAFPVHEFSHAFAAYKLGDSTAKYQGRLTLNPVAHFDPIGGIVLLVSTILAGFPIGWAKPTPVNPYNLRYGRWGDVIVSVAGPVSNLILAALLAIVLRVIDSSGAVPAGNAGIAFILSVVDYVVFINVVLMIFNLLPIPPLDGWHALLGFVDSRTAFTLRQFEPYGFVVLLLIVFVGGRYLSVVVNAVYSLLVGV
jgi:Zn-dependent protease